MLLLHWKLNEKMMRHRTSLRTGVLEKHGMFFSELCHRKATASMIGTGENDLRAGAKRLSGSGNWKLHEKAVYRCYILCQLSMLGRGKKNTYFRIKLG